MWLGFFFFNQNKGATIHCYVVIWDKTWKVLNIVPQAQRLKVVVVVFKKSAANFIFWMNEQ